jgi:tRNA 2-selenouridine synthase
MSNLININDFLKLNKEIPVVDVRSPAEFEQGHIPGAINIPLFNNEERAIVGILYKKSGRLDAVLAGLEIAGKKMRQLAEPGFKAAKNKKLLLHCWRGGMRSASMAWLFETCGIQCFVLQGGYKSYRQFVREYFSFPFNLLVIGGMTGSGKTAILKEIEKQSYQVLKLEEIAHHKGSVFGNLGEYPQNTNEHFENEIFNALICFDIEKPIFVEDESRNIGRNTIPPEFFETLTQSRLIVTDMNKELRIHRLVEDYGNFPKQELKDCIGKISKRLGRQNAQLAIASVDMGNLEQAVEISLFYYDKTYSFGLARKKNSEVISIPVKTTDSQVNARTIIEVLQKKGVI